MAGIASGKQTSEREVHLKIPINYLDGESGKAYGFKLADGKVWLPKSQLKDWEADKSNVSFWIPKWLVEKNKLDHFIDTSYAPSLFE